MPIPVPIEDIAKAVDISDIAAIGTSGFEGGLITDRDKSQGVILVKRENRPRRQRFTIGHELGHFLMPLHLPEDGEKFMCTSADMRESDTSKMIDRVTRMEAEANRFAANMLMPAPLFQTRPLPLCRPRPGRNAWALPTNMTSARKPQLDVSVISLIRQAPLVFSKRREIHLCCFGPTVFHLLLFGRG